MRNHPCFPGLHGGVGFFLSLCLCPECCQPQQKLPPCSSPELLHSALWEATACVFLIWHGITGSLERGLACHMSSDGVWLASFCAPSVCVHSFGECRVFQVHSLTILWINITNLSAGSGTSNAVFVFCECVKSQHVLISSFRLCI